MDVQHTLHKTYQLQKSKQATTIFVCRKDIDHELLLHFPCKYKIGDTYDFKNEGTDWLFSRIADEDDENIIDATGNLVGIYQCEIIVKPENFINSIQYLESMGYIPLA